MKKILMIVSGICLSANCFAYITSADAHKACDPTGVQYDHRNKQFCCGTKGGCPGPLGTVHKNNNDAIREGGVVEQNPSTGGMHN